VDNESFAELLRHHRLALGLTQDQLAERAGLSGRGISDLERGVKRAPRASTVRLLVRGLGLPGAEAATLLRAAQPQRDRAPGTPSGPERHNLPLPTTSFVGRQGAVAQLEQVLGESRLVTITGSGGCGKTRLALEVARAHIERFPQGVLYVEFAPLADGSLVVQTIATTIGVRAIGRSPSDSLAEFLCGRQMLLILDNCEHVIDACAEIVDRLLRACPGLRIVATSRERLNVGGEAVYQIAGLTVPAEGANAEDVALSDAGQLLLERARAVAPGFALTPANSGLIAQVCVQLDGVPLALELAAARMNVLSPQQINARLGDRFTLLVRGPRTAHPRQQTLRATLDWSYGLLDEAERKLFNRLAVFAGDWDLEAIEAVCAGGGLDAAQGLDLLTRLVDKSMVTVSSGEPRRYRLQETIRVYARQCLEASGEFDRVCSKHAAYAVELAKRLGAAVSATGPEASAALEQLKQEWDNLRAALQWTVDSQAGDVALRLAGALAEVWYRLGFFDEGSYWLAKVLALPEAAAPTFERAWALNGAGFLALCQGQYARGKALNEESLTISRMLNDTLLVSRGLINLGVGALHYGHYDTARGLFEQTLAIVCGSDAMGEGMALNNLSRVAVEIGDHAGAERYGGDALALGRALRSAWLTALALTQLGLAAFGRGEVVKARKILEEGVMAARASDDRKLIARSLDALGQVALTQGRQQHAEALLRESLRLRYDVGDWPNLPAGLESCARASATAGQPEQAVRLLGTAAGLRRALQVPPTPREQTAMTGWLPTLRHHLGAEAFDAAWAMGHATPLEQMVADALSTEDPDRLLTSRLPARERREAR
jgi:predicted ATPase/DNA-binding XRE family transcriptional regulator